MPSRWLEVLNSCATRNLPIGHPLSEKDFVQTEFHSRLTVLQN